MAKGARLASIKMQAATEHANRAVELDPRDASALAVAGHVRSFLGKQFAQAMALHCQAVMPAWRIGPGEGIAAHGRVGRQA